DLSCQYLCADRISEARRTRPTLVISGSPVASPNNEMPYQAFTASELDSWLRASPKGKSPAAHECPSNQSIMRKGVKYRSSEEGLAISRMRSTTAARLLGGHWESAWGRAGGE